MLGGAALILAILGGCYYGFKSSAEQSATAKYRAEYNRSFAEDERIRKNWVSRVTNTTLEIELEDRIFHYDTELLQELKDTWKDFYPNADFEFCGLIPKETKYSRERFFVSQLSGYLTKHDALRYLMANRGYLTEHDAELGIDLMSIADTRWQELKEAAVRKDILSAINEKLKARGVSAPMYIQHDGTNDFFPFHGRMYNGIVRWEPTIPASTLHASLERTKKRFPDE